MSNTPTVTTAVELIAQARAMGLTLTVRDGMIHPSGASSPEAKALLSAMRPLKAAILEALTAELEFSLDDVEPLPVDLVSELVEPLPPMGIRTDKQPLPVELWQGGLSPVAALAAHALLRQQYFCTCGADSAGWYVRCNPAHYQVRWPTTPGGCFAEKC